PKGGHMPFWTPDPTFYPSARMAMQGPAERYAFLATLNPTLTGAPDALCVVDVDPGSSGYSQVVGRVEMPNAGDELHHFGWNACSSALCPYAPHPHVERRYLIVPGLRSSRIHIIDTKPDPRQPKIVRVIEPEEVAARAGYTRLHTIHCGPDGVYVSALGDPKGDGKWAIKKVIEIPAEAADPDLLPPLLKGFKAVPPLVTDINLSLDDRFLYVSCWGTGQIQQYDVSDPFRPKLTGSAHLGCAACRTI